MFTLHTQKFWKKSLLPKNRHLWKHNKKNSLIIQLKRQKAPKCSVVSSYIFLFATQRIFLGVYWGHETWVEDQRAKATIAP